jgi:hypothetical protein
MGRIVPPCQSDALADALIDVIRNRPSYIRPRADIAAQFDLEESLRQYERILSGDDDRR